MPLSNHAGTVARILQTIGDGLLCQWQRCESIVVQSIALLISTGHKTGARRRTLGRSHKAGCHAYTVGSKAVDVRGLNVRYDSVCTDVCVTLVVGKHHNDICALIQVAQFHIGNTGYDTDTAIVCQRQ